MSDSTGVLGDAFDLFCAKKIGAGYGRSVYICGLDQNLVVKVEDNARNFQNVIEWETWLTVKGTKFERWFAPCIQISATGSVLIMARTIEPRKHQYPDKLPIFLTDTKHSNYGIYKSRFVCHDYGTNLLMDYGLSGKMRKVEWWD